MIIQGYGVTLIRLRHEHIELVRRMRNADHVKRYMEFRGEITPEMQEKWFTSINNREHNYFIIEVNSEKIGLIYGSQIDWKNGVTGNGGIFLWNEHYIGSAVSMTASLLLLEINFLLGMKHTFVKVLQENVRAKQFNLSLGYRLTNGQENTPNQQYVLDVGLFFSKTANARTLLAQQHGENILVTMDHPEDETEQFLIERYNAMPPENKKRMKLIIK